MDGLIVPLDISKGNGQYVSLPFMNYESDAEEHLQDIRMTAIKKLPEMLRYYPKAKKALDLILRDIRMEVLWDMARAITTGRLKMNDHGKIHAMVAASSSLQILSLLWEEGIKPDIISLGAGDIDDAHVIVLLSALCHDIGNGIHRLHHLTHSLLLIQPILDTILPELYDDEQAAMYIRMMILSAINSHHGDPNPLTLESSVVSIGDASDMTKGRADHSDDMTRASIHAISTLSIENVIITKGKEKPVEIQIMLSHIAGMYQIQETLLPKIKSGIISDHISIYIPLQNQYIW